MDTRVQELELQVYDLQSEVASLREELANMAEIASMAVGEAQQAALRMDRMEQEWLSWCGTAPEGGTSTAAWTAGRYTSSPVGGTVTIGDHPTESFASDPRGGNRGAPPAPFVAAGGRSAGSVVGFRDAGPLVSVDPRTVPGGTEA